MNPDYPMYLRECDAIALSLFATAGSRRDVPLLADSYTRSSRQIVTDAMRDIQMNSMLYGMHPSPDFSDVERDLSWFGPDTKFPSFYTLGPSEGFKLGELIAWGARLGGHSYKSDIWSTYRIKLAEQRWKRYEHDSYAYLNDVALPIMAIEQTGSRTHKTRVRAWSQEVFDNEFSSEVRGRAVFSDGSPYVEDYSGWARGPLVEFKGGHWEQRSSSAIVPENWYPDPKRLRTQLKAMRPPISHSFYTGRTGRVDP
jgi:hypothetical protein